MNDSYLASGYTETNRQHVICQEIGQDWGLDHQDESDADLNICMDYDDALGNAHPNAHDYEQLEIIYTHLDTSTTVGAVTTPASIPNYFSPVVRMRQSLELYANVRPCHSIPHSSFCPNIALVIVRENTEGLYSGIERLEEDGNHAVRERVITRKGSERIIRKAFALPRQTLCQVVHIVHKANVLRQTCRLLRSVAIKISKEDPDITIGELVPIND